ncbi:hypothetical protein [Streptomyces sp. NPDC008125]|uniref:hypothetical protein n=1 Tax=Streptomyces sp. NPDC008125 TaxID=3364811 RepID=UPI0036E4726B
MPSRRPRHHPPGRRPAGPAPRRLPGGRWSVPAAATALLPQLAPVVVGLLWVALLAGTGCDEGCDPAVRAPLDVVTLGYSLSRTLTPAALALCWLLAVRRSWSTARWSAARWAAAGLAYVPPAMIALGVMLLFVPQP